MEIQIPSSFRCASFSSSLVNMPSLSASSSPIGTADAAIAFLWLSSWSEGDTPLSSELTTSDSMMVSCSSSTMTSESNDIKSCCSEVGPADPEVRPAEPNCSACGASCPRCAPSVSSNCVVGTSAVRFPLADPAVQIYFDLDLSVPLCILLRNLIPTDYWRSCWV